MSAARFLGAAVLSAACLIGGDARAVGACGDQVHQNDCGKGNIYPCCDNGGNCTWWAWESVCRNWHIGMVNWGNANTWAGHAHADPAFDVLDYPVVGSIATRDLGAYGHVAWVVEVSGGQVKVTEENCCSLCSAGMRTHWYAASYFNSGYVVRHGTTCECSPGQTETQACGDCGARQRTCGSGCGWGGWGGCNGPDPDGGNAVCATGAAGVCGDGRVRCVGGNTACKALHDPSPEVCDGADNDCNGAVDDGHPPVGEAPPAYAAALADLSYPQALHSGERAVVWADFRNVGTAPWPRDGLWLTARGAGDGRASAFFTPEAWPAWDVAATLQQPVLPGDVGRFTFEVVAPVEPGEIQESFQLQVAGGDPIRCPEADIAPSILILPAVPGAGGGGAGGSADGARAAGTSGCSQGSGDGGGQGAVGLALSLALLAVSRSRRRASRG